MAGKFEFLLAVLAGILAVSFGCNSADYLGADHEEVPCVEVPACPAVVTVNVDQKSTGEGAANCECELFLFSCLLLALDYHGSHFWYDDGMMMV